MVFNKGKESKLGAIRELMRVLGSKEKNMDAFFWLMNLETLSMNTGSKAVR